MSFWVYMLLCENKPNPTYYTGSTNNLTRRVEEHKTGKGGRYTRAHPPIELVFTYEFETLSEARKAEAMVKKLSRIRKELMAQKYRRQEFVWNDRK